MPNHSFRAFVLNEKSNTNYLLLISLITLIVWPLFKLLYPYPNMALDSFFYIHAATYQLNVHIWPIGYSWFIRLTGLVSHSSLFFVTVQYLLLQAAFTFFFFTIRFFFPLTRYNSWILLVFLFLNPLFFYTTNVIMADAFFTAITVAWITLLLWILHRPHYLLFVAQALLLAAAFTVRYNAMYYPFVSTIVVLLCKQRIAVKIAAIGLQLLLVGAFILFTQKQNEQLTGQAQFSAFAGWKMSNNALYLADYINLKKETTVPLPYKHLHNLVTQYFTHPHPPVDLLENSTMNGGYYMFSATSPLKQLMYLKWNKDYIGKDSYRYFVDMAPLYHQYGNYIIKQHPKEYILHFLFPNIQRYLFPPTENYTMPAMFELPPYFHQYAGNWFRLQTLQASDTAIELKNLLLYPWQYLSFFIHLLFIINATGFFLYKGRQKHSRTYVNAVYTILLIWLSDFVFNCTTSAPVLRYQLPILTIAITFGLLFIQYIFNNAPANNASVPHPTPLVK